MYTVSPVETRYWKHSHFMATLPKDLKKDFFVDATIGAYFQNMTEADLLKLSDTPSAQIELRMRKAYAEYNDIWNTVLEDKYGR